MMVPREVPYHTNMSTYFVVGYSTHLSLKDPPSGALFHQEHSWLSSTEIKKHTQTTYLQGPSAQLSNEWSVSLNETHLNHRTFASKYVDEFVISMTNVAKKNLCIFTHSSNKFPRAPSPCPTPKKIHFSPLALPALAGAFYVFEDTTPLIWRHFVCLSKSCVFLGRKREHKSLMTPDLAALCLANLARESSSIFPQATHQAPTSNRLAHFKWFKIPPLYF